MSMSIVPGSLKAVATQTGQSLAESFMSADALILVDVSGSMSHCDVAPNDKRSRYQAACDELARLQATLPGKIAVVAFSDNVMFCWDGKPPFLKGGTDMDEALEFIYPADGTGMTLILISDGWPADPEHTLRVAKRFTSPIQTIFIGPEGDEGAEFLRRLAALTGGQSSVNRVPELAAKIAGLLGARA